MLEEDAGNNSKSSYPSFCSDTELYASYYDTNLDYFNRLIIFSPSQVRSRVVGAVSDWGEGKLNNSVLTLDLYDEEVVFTDIICYIFPPDRYLSC